MSEHLKNTPIIEVKSRDALREWLAEHYEIAQGHWLRSYKKHSPHYLSYDDMVEELMAWGWVDSLVRRYDEDRSMHYIAPRKPRSNWSKPNRERVARLIEEGVMQPAGLAKVEAAKRDGSWDLLKQIEDGRLPEDIALALDQNAKAKAAFEALSASHQRPHLEWVISAKSPDTRARRLAKMIDKLKQFYPSSG